MMMMIAVKLPPYSFVDPRYIDFGPDAPQNDNHPDDGSSTVNAEAFVKSLYEAVRASPQWNQTLLIITYDEHGGFYDTVPTPSEGMPDIFYTHTHTPSPSHFLLLLS